MKNNDNEKIEKTQDFLDLMTRSERKAWERAQEEEKENFVINTIKKEEEQKLSKREEKEKAKQEEKLRKEIMKDKEPLKPLEETQNINTTEEECIQVGELSKTQHFLNLTSEIALNLNENVEDTLFEKEKSHCFNPVIWIGIAIIGCFAYFIYLIIQSGYSDTQLLFIDSCFLLGILFLFGLSILSNRKWTKIFSIINLFVMITFIGINVYTLYQWNPSKEEEVLAIEEKEDKKTLSCSSTLSNIQYQVEEKEDKITSIRMEQTFESDEELEEVKKLLTEQDGFTLTQEDLKLTFTFQLEKLDTNQYKEIMRTYLEYYRESSDFTYVEDDYLRYSTYKDEILKDYQCTEKEGL